MEDSTEKPFPAIPSAILLCFGLAMIGFWAQQSKKTSESQSFVPAQAQITEMVYVPGDGEDDATEFYYSGVLIESGQAFKSHVIRPGMINTPGQYKMIVAQYGEGGVHEVFVSPKAPSKIILAKGQLSPAYGWIMRIGIIVACLGGLFLWAALSHWRKQRKRVAAEALIPVPQRAWFYMV